MYIKNIDFHSDSFSRNNFASLSFSKGDNWPVVYILEDGKSAYIGQTNRFRSRMKEHLDNPNRNFLTNAFCIIDEEFNKSAALDVESRLISYFDADKKYVLLNGNAGAINQEYYQKSTYLDKVPVIWERLRKKGLANKSVFEIENSDLFKFSPYKSLTIDQHVISEMVFDDINNKEYSTSFIEGNPGTGKTILAMYLLKRLKNENPDLKIAFVVSMKSLRHTLKRVVKSINGLKSGDVINPNEVAKSNWDVLIVDESHRLKQRKNLTNYKAFDDINRRLGSMTGNHMDWILSLSKHQVFFYDDNQSIKPTDIPKSYFDELKGLLNEDELSLYSLETQHRVHGGSNYISYTKQIMNNENPDRIDIEDYDAVLYEDFEQFNDDLYKHEREYGLCRMVSGYSFEWKSKKLLNAYDIEIGFVKKRWNVKVEDWINSENSLDEVGCIHTVQGYDLNYIFLIFGYEIDYDFILESIIIDKDKYFDQKGKSGIKDQSDLKTYIINIYTTLMSRGIRGISIYACNPNMRKYLKRFFEVK